MWITINPFNRGKQLLEGLKVINAHAERAVKLYQDYNKYVTRNEDQFQDLLFLDHDRNSLKEEFKRKS